MSNYIVVNKASNLCISVITTSSKPKPSSEYSFFKINEKALEYYYSFTTTNNTLLDIGHLMAVSPYVCDQVIRGHSGEAKPVKINHR